MVKPANVYMFSLHQKFASVHDIDYAVTGPLRGGGGGGGGGAGGAADLLTLGPVIKHWARAARLVTFFFVCVIHFVLIIAQAQ